ncbi:unnamed protein product [Ascophyllum nodosum]
MDSPPLHGWTAHSRWSRRGRSLEEGSERGGQNEPHASTLVLLCLTSLESSLGNGLATLSLEELPIVLADQIYNFIFSRGSRMAQMEISKALAPIMRHHINSFDCSRSRIGNSALLQLASGCGSGLVHLDLSECLFLGNNGILDLMFKCPSIRTLSLSGCNRVSDQVAHHLPYRTPSLTRLDLAGVEGITESGVAYISFLPALEKLCLARCKIGDAAVASLGAGVCRHSIRWLDLTGTGVRDVCIPSLRNMLLEYVALSSTSISVVAMAALARDLRLPALLPEAPKTRARCNRTLLMGSTWSQHQLGHVPRKRASSRRSGAPFHHEHGTVRRSCAEGRSGDMRLITPDNISAYNPSASGGQVEIGFREAEERAERRGRELVANLVRGIVDLWPAKPIL